MKKILSLIICTITLIIAGQAVATPSCPSASAVKNTSFVNIEPAEAPGWYLATAVSGNGSIAVVIYLQAKNDEDAVKTAFDMQKRVTGSWSQKAANIGVDENTNQPVYACEYKPFRHINLAGPIANVPVVIAAFEENVAVPLAIKRKLF